MVIAWSQPLAALQMLAVKGFDSIAQAAGLARVTIADVSRSPLELWHPAGRVSAV